MPDVGPVVAASIITFFAEPHHREIIARLRAAGVAWPETAGATSTRGDEAPDRAAGGLAGKTFVLTGTLPSLSREAATALIEASGGRVSASVSKKTAYVLAGEATGSKFDKSRALGVPVIDEAELRRLLELPEAGQ